MRKQQRPKRALRRFLRKNTYLSNGKLFLRSRRAFRLLAIPLGVSPPEEVSDYEKVFFYVTPGWWVKSWAKRSYQIDAVVVPKTFGRFGNQTLQLAHAITIAKAFKAPEVLCPGNEILSCFSGTLRNGMKVKTAPASVERSVLRSFLGGLISSWSQQAHLVGNLFYTTAFPLEVVTPDDRSTAYQLIKQIRQNKNAPEPLPEDHLVIHLRGGDAFGPNAHNEYGQPPVAFYEMVLIDQSWSQITIVAADEINPVLPHILAKAEDAGIPCSLQSGALDEDMMLLSAAKTLVSSRSTFIPAITAFSDHSRTVFVFGHEDRFANHLTIKRVVDETGSYWESTCVYNWNDEPWQRELMVSYPIVNLSWA